MASASQIGPIPAQYAAAATVPLIKSPSLWLPSIVEMPTDIHPLPDDITAYFVYPFTLEQHVLSQHPAPHVAIAERRARNAAILHAREVEEEAKERAALHRVAPGYNPTEVLVPKHKGGESGDFSGLGDFSALAGLGASGATGAAAPESASAHGAAGAGGDAAGAALDPMDELVAKLEEMERGK